MVQVTPPEKGLGSRTQGKQGQRDMLAELRLVGGRSPDGGTGRAITANELKAITHDRQSRQPDGPGAGGTSEKTDRGAGAGHVWFPAQIAVGTPAPRPRRSSTAPAPPPGRRPPSLRRHAMRPCPRVRGILTCWLPSDECAVRKESAGARSSACRITDLFVSCCLDGGRGRICFLVRSTRSDACVQERRARKCASVKLGLARHFH